MDCSFERDGISYGIDENGVYLKEIKVRPESATPAFPFGLSPNDTIGQVMRKISARKDVPDDLFIVSNEGMVTITTGLCMETSDHLRFEIDFKFGKSDPLEAADASIDTPED